VIDAVEDPYLEVVGEHGERGGTAPQFHFRPFALQCRSAPVTGQHKSLDMLCNTEPCPRLALGGKCSKAQYAVAQNKLASWAESALCTNVVYPLGACSGLTKQEAPAMNPRLNHRLLAVLPHTYQRCSFRSDWKRGGIETGRGQMQTVLCA